MKRGYTMSRKKYNIIIWEGPSDLVTGEQAFRFSIVRTVEIELGITVEDPFPGNWSHFMYESREDALSKALERIKKDQCEL